MENGSSRVIAAVLSLVVGFVAAWLVRGSTSPNPIRPTTVVVKAPVPTPPPAGNWKIKVGANPCHLNDDPGGKIELQQTVSRETHNIQWSADNNMYVVLHVANCDFNPFPNGTKVAKLPYTDKEGRDLYMIGDGTAKLLQSGTVNKEACPTDVNDQNAWITYDQCVQITNSVAFQCCDGWIIIDK